MPHFRDKKTAPLCPLLSRPGWGQRWLHGGQYRGSAQHWLLAWGGWSAVLSRHLSSIRLLARRKLFGIPFQPQAPKTQSGGPVFLISHLSGALTSTLDPRGTGLTQAALWAFVQLGGGKSLDLSVGSLPMVGMPQHGSPVPSPKMQMKSDGQVASQPAKGLKKPDPFLAPITHHHLCLEKGWQEAEF